MVDNLENIMAHASRHLRWAVQHIQYLFDKVTPAKAPVLITGESGTGKDVVPRVCTGLVSGRGGTACRPSKLAMQYLQAGHRPGNIRELHNVIERSMILAEGE